VTAFASLLLAVITSIYVILTWKLLHAPHTAFLQPKSIDYLNDGWDIKIKNYGPGQATNVSVAIRTLKDVTWAPTPDQPQRVFTIVDWVQAEGPTEILVGDTASFHYGSRALRDLSPVLVRWGLVTGKKRMDMWFYKLGFDSKFQSREGIRRIRYYFERTVEGLKSPYFRFQRWRYMRKET
jgi:hypothetical protein